MIGLIFMSVLPLQSFMYSSYDTFAWSKQSICIQEPRHDIQHLLSWQRQGLFKVQSHGPLGFKVVPGLDSFLSLWSFIASWHLYPWGSRRKAQKAFKMALWSLQEICSEERRACGKKRDYPLTFSNKVTRSTARLQNSCDTHRIFWGVIFLFFL